MVGLCGVNATWCGGGRSQCFPRLGWEDEGVTAKVGPGRNAFLDWAGEDEEVAAKVGAGRNAFLDWAGGDEEDTAKCWADTRSKAGGMGKRTRFGERMGEDCGGEGLSEGQWEGRQGAWGWASKRHGGSRAGRRADRDAGRELVSCITK